MTQDSRLKTTTFESLCVKEQPAKITTQPHQLPIYPTSSFRLGSVEQGMAIFSGEQKGDVYSRYGNPTIASLEKKVAALEGYGLDIQPKAVMFSSGMAAISTLMMSQLTAGDKVLTQGNLYGGTTELLVKVLAPLGIKPIFTNLKDLNNIEQHLKQDKSIKLLYCESPANPTLACIDLEAISKLAKQYGCKTAIDNTFPTPYLQQPFRFGIDYVVHSTTKYLNGHGNSIAGMVVVRDGENDHYKVWQSMKLIGTNSNPFDAWMLNNGLKTLPLRMDKHCSNAQQIAEYLEKHHKVAHVNYPGLTSHPDHHTAKKQMKAFGGMISFELKGGLEKGMEFMNKIQFCTMAPTLGDIDTLILHPASSSHINVDKEVRLRNGITDGLIRISVGIEHVEDIIADLEQAL